MRSEPVTRKIMSAGNPLTAFEDLVMSKPQIIAKSLTSAPNGWTARHGGFLVRQEQILMMADRVLGGRDHAEQWMTTRARGLGYRYPCNFLSTASGFLDVETLLLRIERGIYI